MRAVLAALALLLAGAPPALAQDDRRLTSTEAIAIAESASEVRERRGQGDPLNAVAAPKGADRWQVGFQDPGGVERVQVIVSDSRARIVEQWTGDQVLWSMARGYPGAFGRHATALWVWLPLLVLFVVPFLRPPWRLLHLDLLVLASLSVSLAFFSRAEIGVSVPLVYPVLLYVLVRAVMLARRRPAAEPRPALPLLVPATWLVVGIVFLVGFRVALNLADSNVIDVGYAGVIGADRLTSGQELYGSFPSDNDHGDTYGPATYLAYVPAELLLGWSGKWDELPAAHATAIVFDLLTLAGLWVLGRRLRGPTFGVALAWAWVTFPFTLFTANSNANDSLVALLLVWALVALADAPVRGALVALAGMGKLAPLALAPLFARGRGARGYALAFGVTAAAVLLPVLLTGSSPGEIYDRTLGFQASRDSPFSIWGQLDLGPLQLVVQVAAVIAALALAVFPRGPRDVPVTAALATVVLLALQLGVGHWFYLYVVWFLPLFLVASFGRFSEPAPAAAPA